MPPVGPSDQRNQRNALMAVVLACSAIVAAGGYLWFQFAQNETQLKFEYSAMLEPNGTGEVRVSLPIPMRERLLSGIRVVPAISTFTFNRSGPEPALDLVLRGRTFVNATFVGAVYAIPSAMANLTRTGDISVCRLDCSSELAVAVLRGNVTPVRVTLSVSWNTSCDFIEWTLEASLERGARPYPGNWSHAVC